MIVILTGQPFSGKTTLANALYESISKTKSRTIIDGDELRKFTNNTDYSISGRKRNIQTAIYMAVDANKYNDYVIMSLVFPFRDLREFLKKDYGAKEIYLRSSRVREGKMVDYYEPPIDNFLYIDTDCLDVVDSLSSIQSFINYE